MAFEQLTDAVPFYAGPDARGDRRPRRPLAETRARERRRRARRDASVAASARPPDTARQRSDEPPSQRRLSRLGTYRPIWAAPEVEISPALQFLDRRTSRLELSPEDARRLGIGQRRRGARSPRTGPGCARRAADPDRRPRAPRSSPRGSPTRLGQRPDRAAGSRCARHVTASSAASTTSSRGGSRSSRRS